MIGRRLGGAATRGPSGVPAARVAGAAGITRVHQPRSTHHPPTFLWVRIAPKLLTVHLFSIFFNR